MAVAATTVKKPSENSPIKRARPLALRAKADALKPCNVNERKELEKTIEAASLLCWQEPALSFVPHACLYPAPQSALHSAANRRLTL